MQDASNVKMLEPSFDDYGLGRIYRASDNRPVDYQPYEVSRFSLGIIGQQGLAVGQLLHLESQVGRIELLVEATMGHVDPEGVTRYKLVSPDSRVDLEKVF